MNVYEMIFTPPKRKQWFSGDSRKIYGENVKWNERHYWIQNSGSSVTDRNNWYLSIDQNDEPSGCYAASLNPNDLRQTMETLVHISHKSWVDSGELFMAARPLIERIIFNGHEYA